MPDLVGPLEYWKTAFDRTKARDERLLVPERGIEEDFDDSEDRILGIKQELFGLRKEWAAKLGAKGVQFKDVGKEIYQLEVPVKNSKAVPKDWTMVSSTKSEKRYYFPELKTLVRALQEAQETHGQIVKATAGRFFQRFDKDYSTWLTAVNIIAQLDCLISLARASATQIGRAHV